MTENYPKLEKGKAMRVKEAESPSNWTQRDLLQDTI